MVSIEVIPLRDDLSFGVRIRGVTSEALKDEAVRKQINDAFEDRGLILFEGVEPSSQMHVAVSEVFGALKPHPVPTLTRVDEATMPGVIDMNNLAVEFKSKWFPIRIKKKFVAIEP